MSRSSRRVRLNLETRRCALRRSELEAIEDGLGLLDDETAAFSFADLTVTISYRARCDEYHVKTRLHLPGRGMFTGEHDAVVLPAYERCLRKLARKLARDREQAGRSHRTLGIHAPAVDPTKSDELTSRTNRITAPLPLERLKQARDELDYRRFRQELSVFEGLIRERVGRWVRRYSDVEAAINLHASLADARLPIDDLVEEVLLTAFERYPAKPRAMRPGDWLESLIDPAMRSFLRHPEEELEAIGFARTLREMQEEHLAEDACGEFFEPLVDEAPRTHDFARRNELFRRPR